MEPQTRTCVRCGKPMETREVDIPPEAGIKHVHSECTYPQCPPIRPQCTKISPPDAPAAPLAPSTAQTPAKGAPIPIDLAGRQLMFAIVVSD